jgi:SAM-dependent methyltransferase
MRLVSDYGASMPDEQQPQLRLTFEEVPELYDRVRPTYPTALFDDLAEIVRPGAELLEVGCGTGKATRSLAERGYRITCVELGDQLAAIARRNLAGFPAVEVALADFETWPVDRRYDAVVAFTAFHWIDPALRYDRAAQVLREAGVLAVTSTRHVLPADGDIFFAQVQEDYLAVVGEDDGPPPDPADVPDLADEIAESGRFEMVASYRYTWDVAYTADEYVGLLDTYSGHRRMEASTRAALYERIRRRIGDGTVRKTYLATLDVARRR